MQDLTGQTLGQYRVVGPLGQGGMATVFKAFQPSLERYVAVKVLPPYYAHESGFAQRFTREARAVARLEHPHILPVYDFGQEGDYTYIVMKYVPAGTLKDLVRSGPLSPEQTVDIISQIAEALDYAHEQGIIHRDVKPSNVLMDQGQWALLMDFGLAKIVEGSKQLTASGVGVGTPAYMAPEQGQGKGVDERADVYSLGVVLFEMLTGQVPFDAETPMAVVLKHIIDPLPMPRSLNPSIPEPVERVILRALAKDPDDRYATAGQMAAALRQATLGEEVLQGKYPYAPEPMPLAPEAAPPLPEEPSAPEVVEAQGAATEVGTVRPKRKVSRWVIAIGGTLSLLVLVCAILAVAAIVRRRKMAASVFTELTPPSEVSLQPPPTGGIIVDNADTGFIIQAGDWGTCEDGDCDGVSYGADFRYAEPECTSCRARFALDVTAAGEYDVWTWWPRGEDRATDTPFTIVHADGPTIVRVDQRNNGSAWYWLATLAFGAGESVRVTVEGSATGYANADAIALIPLGSKPPGPLAARPFAPTPTTVSSIQATASANDLEALMAYARAVKPILDEGLAAADRDGDILEASEEDPNALCGGADTPHPTLVADAALMSDLVDRLSAITPPVEAAELVHEPLIESIRLWGEALDKINLSCQTDDPATKGMLRLGAVLQLGGSMVNFRVASDNFRRLVIANGIEAVLGSSAQ